MLLSASLPMFNQNYAIFDSKYIFEKKAELSYIPPPPIQGVQAKMPVSWRGLMFML